MNTIDVLNLYHKIIESAPDLQGMTSIGMIEGYSKKRLHDIMMGFALQMKKNNATDAETEQKDI